MTNRNENSSAKWAGYHRSFAQNNSMKELILLDSNLMALVFCNPKYITNIKKANKVLELGTNGVPMTLDMICDLPLFGTVWFNEKSIANIISLSGITKKYRVTMDSIKDKALLVHLPNKIVQF
jgi:hypothetical protein